MSLRDAVANAPLVARGLRQHIEARRSDDALARALSRSGVQLLTGTAIIRGLTTAGRAVDHLLSPGFRRVEVNAPIFVVAPPRSGTTLLYGLLASDPRFVGPRLYESVFPALSTLRLLELGARLGDRLSAGRLDARFTAWEEEVFGEFDPIHRSRYRELEEDMPLFDHLLACPSATRYFPYPERVPELIFLDDRPAAARRAVMDHYRGTVQRLLHRAPAGSTFLAKNVSSYGRLASLLEAFPDARLVHIARDPFKVIPSTIQLFQASLYLGVPPEVRPPLRPTDPALRLHGDAVIEGMRRLLSWERRLPKAQWLTLRFDELIADPLATARRVYDHFDLPRSADAEAALAAQAQRSATYRSRKTAPLTLADCGYREDEVYAELREVFDAYGFAPPG
ncbi:MAG: sulfotransferase [Nannocystaceae bacterium]